MNIDRLKELTQKHTLIKAALYPAIISKRLLLKKKDSLLQKKMQWQKEVLDNLGEMLIGDPIIRVNEFNGIFSVDSHSDIFGRVIIDLCYEEKLSKLCLKYLDINKDVIDVGANIGLYTVMFAKNLSPQKKVLSVEPTKNALQRLRRNIEMNGVVNKVEIFEGVASDNNGSAEIKVIKGKEEYSSLGEMLHPWITNEKWILEKVISTTLDKLVDEKSLNPGFLKVDVEGAEHLVFKGAGKVLSEKRPIILSELSDFLLNRNGSSAMEVIDIIKSHGYDVFDPINPSVQPGIEAFGDIMCFPKEMNVLDINAVN